MEQLRAIVDKMPDFLKPWGEEILLRYVDFQGRTDKGTFWKVFLINFLLGIVLSILTLIPVIGIIFGIISWIYSVGTIVPGIAIQVRRLNDTGKSWPYIFFGLIPCVGWIILLVFDLQDSV